jgi:protein KRI1
VEPSSFQLTPAEILLATDAELNDYVGLKRFAPYRQSRSGKTRDQWDSKRGEKLKAIRQALSHRTGGSNWGGGASAGMEQSSETKKRKGKKERQKAKLATGAGDASESTHGANGVSDPAVVGQKRRHGHDSAEDQAEGITKSADARAKKRRRKKSAQEAEL